MAELAIGLTKTAVEGMLNRVKSAIEEDAKLKVRVQNDLMFISGEFQMMKSFLKVAIKEHTRNEVVLTWVRQIRDLALDVEDCVEFVVHLDKPSNWDWVRRLASSTVICTRRPLALDMAVAEIKQLRTRVEDISQRNVRYNLITDDDSKQPTTTIVVSSPVLPELNKPPAASGDTTFSLLSKVWKDMGKMPHTMGILGRFINNEGSDLEVISLWGSTSTAHLCVTHAFREAYNDPEICRHFSGRRAWIKLMHPFNHDDFLNSLLTQLYATSSHHQQNLQPCFRTTEEYHIIKAELKEHLTKHRYLVILEELFSVTEWDVIRTYLPDTKNGSRIIVATRQLGLVLTCTGEPYQVSDLRKFSDGQSLCAFFSRVCGHNSYIAEFFWQLRRPGVMSLFRGDKEESHLIIDKVRRGIEEKSEHILGSDFERHAWLDVTHLFSLDGFVRRLLWNFQSDDLQARETAAICVPGLMDVIDKCKTIIREYNSLVVINGLRQIDDWNMIKDILLSGATKGCILVITDEKKVARHCVDMEDRAFINNDLEKFKMMDSLTKRNIEEECHLHIGGFWVTRFFSGRQLDAFKWTKQFEHVEHPSEWSALCVELQGHSGVISVWGLEGVGKRTLVKYIYYTNIIGSSHHLGINVTKYSWVDVAYPFNLNDLSRSLLLDFHCDNLEAKEAAIIGMMEGHDPTQECRNFMCQVKCFVVICGLRANTDWDLIKEAFLSETIEGYILVITNEESVAVHCADYRDRVVNVKPLEDDAAFEFFTKDLTSRKIRLKNDERTLSKTIIRKCGGNLKVITAIGEYCHKENKTETALKAINDNFMGMLQKHPKFHNLKGLFYWMQTYFDACPDSLKPCIFYLPIFHSDHGFRRRRLLNRWIAEGYSSDKSAGSTLDDDGETLYRHLIDLGLIHRKTGTSVSNNNVTYQVNVFFRDVYIVSRRMEANLVLALEGHCRPRSEDSRRHLTIGSTWDRDKIVFQRLELSRLRSLTVYGKWESFLISEKMKLLRVLDLEDTDGVTDNDLEQIGNAVTRLKFLSLRGCEEISRLPDSLGEMKQLQTLDVRGTRIVELPYVVIKLKNLQYVRAGMPSYDNVTSTMTTSVVEEATIEPVTSTMTTSVVEEATIEPEEEEEVPPPATTTEDVVGGCCSRTFLPTPRVRRTWRKSSTSDSGSWLSKLMKRSRHHCGNANNCGIKVVVGVGTLTALHTIGVVNVSGAARNAKVILEEFKELTQLRKLGVSGITRKNWQDLWCVISGYAHLESLSVRLDGNSKQHYSLCSDDIPMPPKTLGSLKLYGGTVQVPPLWLKHIDNLTKVHLDDPELILSTQLDIDSLINFPHHNVFHRLCVKPIQDGQLSYGWYSEYDLDDRSEGVSHLEAPVLSIDCSVYEFEIAFGPKIPEFLEVLVVRCSTTRSSLKLSGIQYLGNLKEVWLKGTYSSTLREHLQEIVAEHKNKPVFNLDDERTHQSP